MVKPVIAKKTQLRVYRQFKDKIFQENGKAKPYTDGIYKILLSELKGMKEKAIQMSINRNIKSILECDQEASESDTCSTLNDDDNDDDNDVDDDDNDVDDDDNDVAYPEQLLFVNVTDQPCSSPLSNSYGLEDARFEANAEADVTIGLSRNSKSMNSSQSNKTASLMELYHKDIAQEKAEEEINQVHKSIDEIIKRYKNEISRQTEIKRVISYDFEHHRKTSAEEKKKLLTEIATVSDKLNEGKLHSQSQLKLHAEQCDVIVALRSENNAFLDREKLAEEEKKKLLSEIATVSDKLNEEKLHSQSQLKLHAEQCDVIVALRSENNAFLDREKLAEEEKKKLLSEIATVSDKLNEEKLHSQSQLKLHAEQCDVIVALRSENNAFLDREKLAEEEKKKLLSEIATVSDKLNEGKLHSQSQLKLHAEQCDVIVALRSENNAFLDREKLAEEEKKKLLSQIAALSQINHEKLAVDENAQNELDEISKAHQTKDGTLRLEIVNPKNWNEQMSPDIQASKEQSEKLPQDAKLPQCNKPSRKRKLAFKYFGNQWSN